ncbi:DUF2116 family Zn-ribbon domain-containing protein [Jeongeupia chitinilytica]|uniref:DUF2116 family Zn-ribbon domain-containing protein n=1 Tax=Jeongeupia chitinilytica TaxID=1041641 RepID=A0ABQ3GXA5_9NEIS|nr:DUF2116 family Zn-ribbon domain-containing protein [Jeongeupia chitinilytica]GHD59776.1 hypothetical protein GCM10007350_11500 [Jeongeupia chitinilytica]
MSRIFDLASDREQEDRDRALDNVRRKACSETPKPSGVCPWCEEPAPAGATFCDTECAQDWQANHKRVQTAARINGARA